MNSRWKKYLSYTFVMIMGGFLLFILIQTVKAKNTGFETKTLWDWMELLIIPSVLVIGAFYLNRSERAVERQVAEDRAELEREIATDRQQETALQAYLDRMADLLLKEKLRTSKNKEIRNVARIRTLTVLRGLDDERKGTVLLFLKESGLINRKAIVDLSDANFDDMFLVNPDLEGVNLRRASLFHVSLPYARLIGADLSFTYPGDADLAHAVLTDADLTGIILKNTNLTGANLIRAKLILASLERTNMSKANLREADLSGARFIGANLRDADLTGADLTHADLTDANMTDVKISYEQLMTAKTLKGAIMPDGTKHD